MSNIVQVRGLLPVYHKRMADDEIPVCSIWRFSAFRLRTMQRESFNSGIEYLLRSDRGEEIMVYCLLPEYGVIGKIKWYSETDPEMCDYLIKAFIQKYLRKQYFIRIK